MEVGLRSTGKPVEKLPNPGATAPRFYSTNNVLQLITITLVGGKIWVKWPCMSRGKCPQDMCLLVMKGDAGKKVKT